MTGLHIVGGLYAEECVSPQWNEVFGSGGRAAAATAGSVQTRLTACIDDRLREDGKALAERCKFDFDPIATDRHLHFWYMHPLATPEISPPLHRLGPPTKFSITDDVVLRFGMLEADPVVSAKTAIYDPQSAFTPASFADNGSTAERLAIVLNSYEATALVGVGKPDDLAQRVMVSEKAQVVILKRGSHGAIVAWPGGSATVPAYRTDNVWKIGSGDVFSAAFALFWGIQNLPPVRAAELASRATADYCNCQQLPIRPVGELDQLKFKPISEPKGQIYLAGPFFDLGQRWMIEEARKALLGLGAKVFSPIHDVGAGPAEMVAPADLRGLDESQVVLAILNGTDSGTIFEVGYAVNRSIPVVALAQNVKDEDLKMITGSGCRVTKNFTTAIYLSVWSLPTG
jgi:nucleoside 2-deoxyribosyltransferase